MSEQNQSRNSDGRDFPWQHVIGFILSIVLTLLSLWIAFKTSLSTGMIMAIIIGFAFLQAAVQLFMFMHVTESEDGRFQMWNMVHAFIAFVIIIVGSIWVMSFGMSYMNHM
ncbi:MAG TPA: cytochrome aa3 quinol oxidase subunit IV [Bacillales bacterium]|nr:cytochrome aa3 quinol oxidase subunit IV [Bacillales bacterium]